MLDAASIYPATPHRADAAVAPGLAALCAALGAALLMAGCGAPAASADAASADAASADAANPDPSTADAGDGAGDAADTHDASDPTDADATGPTDGGSDPGAAVDPIAFGQGPLPALDKPLATGEAADQPLAACRVAAYFAGDADSAGAALLAGDAKLPAAGALAYGKTWQAAVPDAAGEFPAAGSAQGTTWTLCRLELAAETRLVAQVDRAFELRWAGHRLPADLYGSGRLRLPLRLPAGSHLIGARGRGGQKLRLRLWTAPTALQLAASDVTAPDLRVGHKEPLWLGMPLLETDGVFSADVRARVVAGEHFAASEVGWPGLVPGGAGQIGWKLVPKAAPTTGVDGVDEAGAPKPLRWPLTLEVVSAAHPEAVRVTLELEIREGEQAFRQTFRDKADASVQYYGVRPPRDFDPQRKDYGMVLTLHGAGVEGIGQAQAYGAKTWTWHIAPTNRRPFGFDWEEWGKWNGLHALDDAMARFGPDPTRVWLGGHSMGGHGTWQFAVHHSGRFAVVGPSAGWDSFYTYGGAQKPQGVVGRARAHSDTSHFLENLGQRAVYVIHGTADDNVPWSEGKTLRDKVAAVSTDVAHHWQQGAGHWWDGDAAEGADCVDWPPLFALMQQRPLDPFELSFHRRSPGPYYSPDHSYLRVDQAASPMVDTVVDSVFDGATLQLSLRNVRRARVDGAALRQRGLKALQWRTVPAEGAPGAWQEVALPEGPLVLGPEGGKRVGQSGPFNQAFQRAFAFIVPDGDAELRRAAAHWATTWQQIGNGHAVVLPASLAAHAVAAGRNLIWYGAPPTLPLLGPGGAALPAGALPVPLLLPGMPGAPAGGPTLAGATAAGAAALTVYPRGEGVDAVLWAPADKRALLYAVQPFSSRSGLPDWLLWDETGLRAAGFWAHDWTLDPALAQGL